MTRPQRILAALAVVVGLIGATVIAVRASYGAFHQGYTVVAVFDRASYGVDPGVQVEYHGIAVGKVTSVHLVGRQAELILSVNKGFRVPATVRADLRPRSIFGDPYVDLVFPASAPGPYLAAGAHVTNTGVDSEVGDLIASTVPLLNSINGPELQTILHELAETTDQFGPQIHNSVDEGARLVALYSSTIGAQLRALDSFAQFQAAIAPTGQSLDAAAANSNIALPRLNAAEADFQRFLDTLTPFANELANFIGAERPDITKLLDNGDNVVRLLTVREPQIEQVVAGLGQYLFKFAHALGPETLPNGTKFAFFKLFVMFSDVNNLVCGLIHPTAAGSTFLQPLQQAVDRAGVFDCTAYQKSQAAAARPSSASQAPVAPAPPAPPTVAADLNQGIHQLLGQPDVPQQLTVQSLVNLILGKS